MQRLQNDRYIKLGVIILEAKKYGYEVMKYHLASQITSEPKQVNNLNNSNISPMNNNIYSIQCISSHQYTWKNSYYLIFKKDLQNESNSKQKQQIERQNQIEYFIGLGQKDNYFNVDKSKVEIRFQDIQCLMNLLDRSCIKICNPSVLEQPQRISLQYESNNLNKDNANIYYIQNIQQTFNYQIGVQVWVQELFLEDLNLNYEKFEENLENINYSFQEKAISERSNKNTVDIIEKDQNNQIIKKSKMPEKQLIQILKHVYNQQILNKNKIERDQIKKLRQIQCYQRNDIYFNQQNSENLRPYVSATAETKFQNQKNNILSLNFKGQKDEAGLHFDLNVHKTPETKKPSAFIGQLKPYQARALTWMLFRQGAIQYDIGIDMQHSPFWWNFGNQLGIGEKLMINKYLNFVTWKKSINKKCKGGILADQMGLGKTIMIIALILSNRPNKNLKTLIICPLSVVRQWKNQIQKFAPTLKVHVVNESKLSQIKLQSCDIVISTQGKVRSQLNKQSQQRLILNYEWFRVVIDEAHNFKNSNTLMAKTVYELQSQYRWCLTGTPTQNSISDLFSLVKFLRFMPWCLSAWWNKLFPINVKYIKNHHFVLMKKLLKGILLRRKKQSVDEEGQKILRLPKIDVQVHLVKMSVQARILYQLVDYRAQISLKNLQILQKRIKKLKNCQNQPSLKVLKRNINEAKKLQYRYVLSLMMKMRMICCHQFLSNYRNQYVSYDCFISDYLRFLSKNNVERCPKYNFFQYYFASIQEKKKLKKPTKDLNKVYQNWDERLKQISRGKTSPCLICQNFLEGQAVITPCLHSFCRRCIQSIIFQKWGQNNQKQAVDSQKKKNIKFKDFQSTCPQCQQSLRFKQLYYYPRLNQFNRCLDQYKQNQKIMALVSYIKKTNQTDKGLVFSSFIGMMTLISFTFQRQGITHLIIQGIDSYQSRHEKIKQFNTNPKIKILILSLKIGSVGLNMQAANKVFFMDPWWNPALQEQAIARAHRIGQKKDVQAIKFITQSSIETKILKMSIQKKKVNDLVLDIDDVANDQRYSKSRFLIKYLLMMEQTYKEEEQDSDEEGDQEKGNTEMKSNSCKYDTKNQKIEVEKEKEKIILQEKIASFFDPSSYYKLEQNQEEPSLPLIDQQIESQSLNEQQMQI